MPIPFLGTSNLEFKTGSNAPTNPGVDQFVYSNYMNREPIFIAQLLLSNQHFDWYRYNEIQGEQIFSAITSGWILSNSDIMVQNSLNEISTIRYTGSAGANFNYEIYKYPSNVVATGSFAQPHPGTAVNDFSSIDNFNGVNSLAKYVQSIPGVQKDFYIFDYEANTLMQAFSTPFSSGAGAFFFYDKNIAMKQIQTDSLVHHFSYILTSVGSAFSQVDTPMDFGDASLNLIAFNNFGTNDFRLGDFIYVHCVWDEVFGTLAQPFLLKIAYDLSSYEIITYSGTDAITIQLFADEITFGATTLTFAPSQIENKIYLKGYSADPSFIYAIQLPNVQGSNTRNLFSLKLECGNYCIPMFKRSKGKK